MKRFFALIIISLLTAAQLSGQSKEIVKTGINLGPLPAVAFDADKGFQMGGLLNIYDFGDGSTYPNPRQQWYMEASFFTKGSQLYVLSYDSKVLIPGMRFSTSFTMTNDKAMDFYGFNGYMSYYDSERVELGKTSDDYFLYSPKYRVDRIAALFKADLIGNLWDNKLFWEAGYHLNYFKQGAINREKINKNKEEHKMFPDSETTIYEQYRSWGLIPDEVAGGGLGSSIRLGLLYDTRDKEGAPSRGTWAEAHITAAPKWLGSTTPYYKYSATLRQYFPLVPNDVLTLAYRLNYEGTFGKDAPYYILPYITTMGQSYDRDGMGGFRTTRGLMRNRVQGLDMLAYNAELRWRFVQFPLFNQNIALGLNIFSDGAMVTKNYDMSFRRSAADFRSADEYAKARKSYDEYMALGQKKDSMHSTVGAGFRFIMNQNFIVCLEYGKPIGKYAAQDGNGAFYINTGYLF